MQEIETKDKISLPRVKWLETSPNEFWAIDIDTNKKAQFSIPTFCIRKTSNIKHLSLLDRLKRMFKR